MSPIVNLKDVDLELLARLRNSPPPEIKEIKEEIAAKTKELEKEAQQTGRVNESKLRYIVGLKQELDRLCVLLITKAM